MSRRRALGKGLGSILPEVPVATSQEGLRFINSESIVPNRFQPRETFEEGDLDSLAESIRKNGILQPIVVRPREGRFEIIAGERRWRAALKAGLKRVPARVQEADDSQALELAMVENLQRKDLDPMEEARGYLDLAERFGLKQEEIAARVGRSRPAIANALRLLKLPADLKDLIKTGALTRGHARALLALDDPAAMRKLAERMVKESLTVRSAEAAVKGNGRPGARKEPTPLDPNIRSAQERLQRRVGTQVKIQCSPKGKGHLEIYFESQEELSRLFDGIMAGSF
jgi:ParB family chromosome partitioning protein